MNTLDESLRQEFLIWLADSACTVFFGGAGVSVPSGIPDFRSSKGIYKANESAEAMLNVDYLLANKTQFWPFYRRVFMAPNHGPNIIHQSLAKMERQGRLAGVITQNIDGLHQEAGSKRVLELHGTGQTFSCLACRASYTAADLHKMDTVPICPSCSGPIRPDIVLFGEGLDTDVVNEAIGLIACADLILVAGTSLVVYPAAGFLAAKKPSAKLVIMNKDETAYDQGADMCLSGDLVETFRSLELCQP